MSSLIRWGQITASQPSCDADVPMTASAFIQMTPPMADAVAVALVEKDAYIGELKTINGILEEKVRASECATRGRCTHGKSGGLTTASEEGGVGMLWLWWCARCESWRSW